MPRRVKKYKCNCPPNKTPIMCYHPCAMGCCPGGKDWGSALYTHTVERPKQGFYKDNLGIIRGDLINPNMYKKTL